MKQIFFSHDGLPHTIGMESRVRELPSSKRRSGRDIKKKSRSLL
jgi:hypothetical protein